MRNQLPTATATTRGEFPRWWRVVIGNLFLLPGSLLAAKAQVPNDDIEWRRVLSLNEAVVSSTTDCTVQWACVDEKLTGKCIEYHNDQWFEFTPRTSGRYYVNIGGQKCRDTRGVQLVVLTGQPCQPATYRVLSCTSLGSQDDVFVTLDSLRAGQPYLLDVDGYLKDFCQFSLTVSDKAQGVPAQLAPALASVAPTVSSSFTLRWTLPDSLGAVQQFRVLRREAAAFRASEVATVPVQRTTYGTTSPEYVWTDTLSAPGRYLYQVITKAADGTAPAVVQQQWYAYSLPLLQSDKNKVQAAAEGAKRAAKAQQSWERRGHRARMKRLAGQRHPNT
ncbi:hypothetical protein [Hymenobacter sublimis]|uniref:Fibronectin type-III domain-containing protein n=1 Tax=Hymenobacter sublimis TaxID=2933777 RepID=A0ABY4JCL3_9BACT|nr:hypothetical protein [Hymenobacter sublimis]UPL49532.1 hypothetical protein MWH26_01160 [Hymenobacter sublimis]